MRVPRIGNSFLAGALTLAGATLFFPAPATASNWTYDIVFSGGAQKYTAVEGHAYTPSGAPAIAYGDGPGGWAHYAELTPSGWAIANFGTGGQKGYSPSLEFDSKGSPGVAFGQAANLDKGVRYAHRDSTGWNMCTVWWGLTSTQGSLAFDSIDRAHIGGATWQAQEIHVTSTDPCANGTTNTLEKGGGSSIAFLPNGTLMMSYVRDGILKAGIDSDSSTVLPTVDGSGLVLPGTHLVISPTGVPHIAYSTNENGGQIILASLPGEVWEFETIGQETGTSVSLAFDPDGLPTVAYVHSGTSKFLFRAPPNVPSNWLTETLTCCQAGQTSLAYAPDGRATVAVSHGNTVYFMSRSKLNPSSAPVTDPASGFGLQLVGPNPTLSWSEASFSLTVPAPGAEVYMALYDVAGRLVATVLEGHVAPGEHLGCLETAARRKAGAGVYFLRMEAAAFSTTRRVVFVR